MTDDSPLVDSTDWRIVQMLADGYHQGDIAPKVLLSLSAVHRHLAKLRARLGANTSAHLVAIAMRRGWIR